MQRERLGSRLGFILLSAGCAIGIGNVWKFPYMVGQNGGGAFVLLYLFFLLVMGIPVMTIEFSLGRASRKSPVRIYHAPVSYTHLPNQVRGFCHRVETVVSSQPPLQLPSFYQSNTAEGHCQERIPKRREGLIF